MTGLFRCCKQFQFGGKASKCSQFPEVPGSDFFEHGRPRGSKTHAHHTTVMGIFRSIDQTRCAASVKKADHGVMLHLKAIRYFGYCRPFSSSISSYGKQQLMLLRRQTRLASTVLCEAQKLA